MADITDLPERVTSTMSDGNLPTFICIGAMKCGTTSLHKYLGTHPDVCVSSPKETDFFLRRTDRDLDWYRQCFAESARAYGETSTCYSKHPAFDGVPERMHSLLPDIKLLYLVRDPVERAVSHWIHNWAVRREHDSVEEALCPPEKSWYVNVSRYHFQISKHLEFYAPEDICVVESERLRGARVEVLSEIFEFIGVEPDVKREQVQVDHHKSEGKRRRTDVAEFLVSTDVGRSLKSVVKAILPPTLVERTRRLLQLDAGSPTASPQVRERLRDFLKEDVEKLRRMTGKKFTSWTL